MMMCPYVYPKLPGFTRHSKTSEVMIGVWLIRDLTFEPQESWDPASQFGFFFAVKPGETLLVLVRTPVYVRFYSPHSTESESIVSPLNLLGAAWQT